MTSVTAIVGRVLRFLAIGLLGFVVGGVSLYVIRLHGGVPPSVWHEVELTEEFSTERAGDVRTFEAYRRLEDALFAELREEVYAHTGAGTEHSLVRYSEGSAADPARWTVDWNRSFELPADEPVGGVLLLHGMSDSPYSLRALGQSLERRGYWVIGLRLPGHGTVPAGLKSVTWQDMAAAVRLGMAHLGDRVGPKPVHVVGYSTGAPLALDYSLEALAGVASPRPASLVLISPAIGVTPAAAVARWLVRAARLPGLEKLAWTAMLPEFDPFKYNSFTSNAGVQVHDLTLHVAGRMAERAASGPVSDFPPTMVLLSSADATVSVDAVVDNLFEHLAPARNELVLFDINRSSVKSTLLISDPAPLTRRLLTSDQLPFHFTLVTNASADSASVIVRRKPALTEQPWSESLGVDWPQGAISLSHIALPFPPDDRLYGRHDPEDEGRIYLGQIGIQGERGLLRMPADWLVRLRHNPFYDYLESRAIEWITGAGGETARD